MFKKLLSIALAALLTIALVPAFALAAATGYSEAAAPKYDQFWYFAEGMAGVGLNGKYGFIDKTGKEVVELKYDSINNFSEGLASVCLNDKWGVIDKTGKLVVPIQYDYINPFSEGYSAAYLNGKCGFIDTTGKLVIPHTYDSDHGGFQGGLAAVGLRDAKTGNETWGAIDKTGKVIVPLNYNDVRDFNEGMAVVIQIDEENWEYFYGVVDSSGKEVVAPKYAEVRDFSEGLAAIMVYEEEGGYAYGFIDKTGKEVVAPDYDDVSDFSNGAALLYNYDWDTGKSEYYVADVNGKVSPLSVELNDLIYFGGASDGLFLCFSEEGYSFVLNKAGKVIATYDFIGPFSGGYAAVADWEYDDEYELIDSMHGFIDASGTLTKLPCDDVGMEITEGMLAVFIGDKVGYISIGGTQFPAITAPKVTTPVTPTVPTAPPAAVATAKPSYQQLEVNGVLVSSDRYNINESNYFKLRDLAYILSGTSAQFDVGYDDVNGVVILTSGKPYTLTGNEMGPIGTTEVTATLTDDKVMLDGVEISLTAYKINNSNYFKLRDVGNALGFEVDYVEPTMIVTTE